MPRGEFFLSDLKIMKYILKDYIYLTIIYQSGDLVMNLGTNLRTNSGGVFCGNNITVLKARKLRVWQDLNIWWNGISVKD